MGEGKRCQGGAWRKARPSVGSEGHVRACMCAGRYMCVHTCVCMYTQVCTCMCLHVTWCVCACVYSCVDAYEYICVCACVERGRGCWVRWAGESLYLFSMCLSNACYRLALGYFVGVITSNPHDGPGRWYYDRVSHFTNGETEAQTG